jgi:hypothetical protein
MTIDASYSQYQLLPNAKLMLNTSTSVEYQCSDTAGAWGIVIMDCLEPPTRRKTSSSGCAISLFLSSSSNFAMNEPERREKIVIGSDNAWRSPMLFPCKLCTLLFCFCYRWRLDGTGRAPPDHSPRWFLKPRDECIVIKIYMKVYGV